MSEGERKIADTTGQIMLAAKDGRPLPDAEWKQGRILLSTKRLILATSAHKQTVPLAHIQRLGGRLDASIDARQVSDYLTLRLPDRTYLVAASEHERFEEAVFRALLHGKSLYAKHPAVEGGVVTDQGWEGASLTLDEEGLGIAIRSGRFVNLSLNELSGLETEVRSVNGEQRLVVGASHIDEDGTIVETHLAGSESLAEHLRTYLKRGMSRTETNVDLSETERAVLMGLYSGVSPFDIPSFLGRDVDQIEEIYERLLDLDLVDEVRKRRDVRLNARGRNIAGSVSENQ